MIALIKPFLGVLTFGVTIPLWLIVAVGGWFVIDKGSAVRQAVDRAVVELVAGAELEAERARAAGLEKINAELRGRATALALANSRFAESLDAAQSDLEAVNGQLAEILANPVNAACAVDPAILERLRSR